LVLDEPTNLLDLATKDMLTGALKDFEGTMIFVSHDRSFLRWLSSRVLELGGESGTSPTPVAYPGRTSSTSHAPATRRLACTPEGCSRAPNASNR
jgi:ATPase subunit of ABC transporter with duplicated ATPase domains